MLLATHALVASATGAQQTNLTPAGTTPGHMRIYPETQFRYYARDGQNLSELRPRVTLGISGLAAVSIESVYDFDFGWGDTRLAAKYRFHQNDSGNVDTLRAAVYSGVSVPTGAREISTDSIDPFLGVVGTWIRGRHGWNTALTAHAIGETAPRAQTPYQVEGELLHFDASYAWRVSPAQYGPDFVASSYFVLDHNLYLGGADNSEAWIAPGLLYEAPDFALELSLLLPIWQETGERPESDYGVLAGLRLLF